MPGGVVFLVCIPTLSYEHELVFGVPLKRSKKVEKNKSNKIAVAAAPKVDLRLKEARSRPQLLTLDDAGNNGRYDDSEDDDDDGGDVGIDVGFNTKRQRARGYPTQTKSPSFVSMETVKCD